MDLSAVIGIAVATIAAGVLRWVANRWPSPEEARKRLRQDRLEELEDRLRIKQLERELEGGS